MRQMQRLAGITFKERNTGIIEPLT